MVAPVPAKRGRKPAAATAPATGQVQSLTRGLKLLEWIAESNGSVALTDPEAGWRWPLPISASPVCRSAGALWR